MLRDNLAGLIEPMLSSARAYPLALCTDRNESSDDRPQDALKIPARQGGIYTLAENVASPFHAEPPHDNKRETTLTVSNSVFRDCLDTKMFFIKLPPSEIFFLIYW